MTFKEAQSPSFLTRRTVHNLSMYPGDVLGKTETCLIEMVGYLWAFGDRPLVNSRHDDGQAKGRCACFEPGYAQANEERLLR